MVSQEILLLLGSFYIVECNRNLLFQVCINKFRILRKMYDQITGKKRLVLVGGVSLTLTVIIIIIIMADSATFPRSSLLLPVSVFGSASNFTSDSLAGALYVENAQSNSLSVIDLATNAIVTNITLGEAAFDVKLSDDQLTLYMTHMHSGTLIKINTTNYELVEQIPTGVSVYDIANFNGTLYVGDVFGGKILVMNENDTVVDTIKVGSGPQDIEVRPDGEVLYVANLWSPISVVDLKQNKMIKEIDTGDTPHGLSFTKDGAKLFLVNTKSDTLSVIDAYKHEIIKTIPVGDNPQYVAFTPDETLAYVTNMDSNTVSIVDAQEIEVINEIPVGDGPDGIAFSADGGDLAYVSNMRGNDVSVINATNGKVIATISAGGVGPHQIITRKPDLEIVRTADNIDNNNSSVTARVFVEVADDQDETMTGLMFRKHLPWNAGMLFVFHNEEPRTFWMKNTVIPLDMIFVDSNLKIVDIKENVPPCAQGDECPLYPSKEHAQYVLEVNAGFVQENGIKIGDQFAIANELNK
jgi:YVTN family beta-propeller protein